MYVFFSKVRFGGKKFLPSRNVQVQKNWSRPNDLRSPRSIHVLKKPQGGLVAVPFLERFVEKAKEVVENTRDLQKLNKETG